MSDIELIYGARTPYIYNLTLTSANTEYPQELPRGARKISVRPRDLSHSLKMSYTSGASGTSYVSIDQMASFNDLLTLSTERMLYFQSPTAGAVVEIEVWV